MSGIIEKAKAEFGRMVEAFGSDPYYLTGHVPEVEKWARHLLAKRPETDEEIVLLGVWLHDLGHYPVPTDLDHAARGEERARAFLAQEGYPSEKMEKVLHCVRAHRCKDVMPATLEAKIVACADSASHMTHWIYFNMAMNDKAEGCAFRAYAKMERDFRDTGAFFPEIQDELKGLCDAWKNVIREYEKIDL